MTDAYMDGAVQRMMNIKIAKAFRTLSYEASCVLAADRQIQLAIEEKYEIIRQLIIWSIMSLWT